jgi:hypothetical protein
MLSDFDLAKQSTEPSGLPTMVHSERDGVSNQFYYYGCSIPGRRGVGEGLCEGQVLLRARE